MAINFLFVNILYIIVWYHYKGDLLAFHLSPQLNLFDKHRGHMTSLNHKLHTLSHNLRLNYIVYFIPVGSRDIKDPKANYLNTKWTLRIQ